MYFSLPDCGCSGTRENLALQPPNGIYLRILQANFDLSHFATKLIFIRDVKGVYVIKLLGGYGKVAILFVMSANRGTFNF